MVNNYDNNKYTCTIVKDLISFYSLNNSLAEWESEEDEKAYNDL